MLASCGTWVPALGTGPSITWPVYYGAFCLLLGVFLGQALNMGGSAGLLLGGVTAETTLFTSPAGGAAWRCLLDVGGAFQKRGHNVWLTEKPAAAALGTAPTEEIKS